MILNEMKTCVNMEDTEDTRVLEIDNRYIDIDYMIDDKYPTRTLIR